MSRLARHQALATDKHTKSLSEIQLIPSPSESAICPLLNERAFDCPVCLDLLCEPVTLSCGHTFCEHCVSRWIASHTSSRSRNKGKCRCPSCKALIHNKFEPQSISYTLREFLKNQFPLRYTTRYNETHPCRQTWNKRLHKLKQKRDKELKHLSKCCGIIKLKRWLMRNVDLMINPDLHRSLTSWLLRWLLLYIVILCITLPYLVPLVTRALNYRNNKDIPPTTYNNNYDIFAYVSSWFSMAPVLHLCQNVLEYFRIIVPITNTAYLSDNYIMNSVIPYAQLGNIYHRNYTDYKSLFAHWKSSELKAFIKRYGMDETCMEKSCYTDHIIQYLKLFEWETLQDDPLPMGMLQEYLDHYEIGYDECYISFWSKDYECIAKKAASIKIVNDVYYNKKYLFSWRVWKTQQRWMNKHNARERGKEKEGHEEYKEKPQASHQQRSRVFDIGHFAFNVLSGLR
eukprot:238414_1